MISGGSFGRSWAWRAERYYVRLVTEKGMDIRCNSNLSQYHWHRVMPRGDKHEGNRSTGLTTTLPRSSRHDSVELFPCAI